MSEYKSEKEALETASKMLEISLESIEKVKPKKVFYEFPLYKWLDVYEIDKDGRKLTFGVSPTRTHGRKVFYGLWIIEGEEINRV